MSEKLNHHLVEAMSTHAADTLPSVMPSQKEVGDIIDHLTGRVVANLKCMVIDIPSDGRVLESDVAHAVRSLGELELLVGSNLTSTTTSEVPKSSSPDVYRTNAWKLLVAQQFAQIDQNQLQQELTEDGRTHRERSIDNAAHVIAHGRAIEAHGKTYPHDLIQTQLLAAQKGGSEKNEADIRELRARKELGPKINPDKHPDAHAVYQHHWAIIHGQLARGDMSTLTPREQHAASKELGSIGTLANARAQELVTQQIQAIVAQLSHQRNAQLLKQTHWERELEKVATQLATLPPAQQREQLDAHLAQLMRRYAGIGENSRLSQKEQDWVIRISDHELTKLLAQEGIGGNGIPLTYDMLQHQMAEHHVVLPEMHIMVEINRRLTRPDLNAIMVLCPDYTRDYHGTQVTYRFDGLGGGLGLVGEVGLPVILPLAERVSRIQASTITTDAIPTFHLRYADIEATEGNIASTKVGTRDEFLNRLDQSGDTLAREIQAYFGQGYHITRVDEPGELLQERTLVVQDSHGKPLVRFRIGALTSMLAEQSHVAPSEQFAHQTAQVREEKLRLLREGSPRVISDIDSALIERLPIVMKLQWDDLEGMNGAQVIHHIAALHNELAANNFTHPISERKVVRGIESLVKQLNTLIRNHQGVITPRTINKVILQWLAENMPDTLHVLRAKHVTQLAEYATVCSAINRRFGESAVQIVGDSLVMNQKAARGTGVPQLLIKGRVQYSGSVAEEELAEA